MSIVNVTDDNNPSKLLKILQFSFPVWIQTTKPIILNLLTGIAEIFNVNVEQINEFYNNSFIAYSSGEMLDLNILDISDIHRFDNETDEHYKERYLKYIYQYNSTHSQILNIVYDVISDTPYRIFRSGNRTSYYGEHDTSGEITRFYYNDIEEYTPFYRGDLNENGFQCYIYLKEEPTEEQKDYLCEAINRIRKAGTSIYIVWETIVQPIIESDNITINTFDINQTNEYENIAFYEITIATDIDFEDTILENATYPPEDNPFLVTGLTPNTLYYVKLKVYTVNGASEFSDILEVTTLAEAPEILLSEPTIDGFEVDII